MESNETVTTLTNEVKAIKLIARDALRSKLISNRLSNVGSIESTIARLNKDIVSINEEIDVEVYEMGKLDTKHPRYEARKKEAEESIANHKKSVERLNADIKVGEESLAIENKAIQDIETGETKVSAEDLADLTSKLIVEKAKNKVS